MGAPDLRVNSPHMLVILAFLPPVLMIQDLLKLPWTSVGLRYC